MVLYDNEIINTAIWCLSKDQRELDELVHLRQAALLLLREIAKAKIEVSFVSVVMQCCCLKRGGNQWLVLSLL